MCVCLVWTVPLDGWVGVHPEVALRGDRWAGALLACMTPPLPWLRVWCFTSFCSNPHSEKGKVLLVLVGVSLAIHTWLKVWWCSTPSWVCVCDAYNAKLRSRAVTKHLQAGVSHNTTKKQSTREVKRVCNCHYPHPTLIPSITIDKSTQPYVG